MFWSGTAAIWTSVKMFQYRGKQYELNIDPKINAGPIAYEIYKTLSGIQYGEIEHKFSKIICKLD